jgi:hypothetical protein
MISTINALTVLENFHLFAESHEQGIIYIV